MQKIKLTMIHKSLERLPVPPSLPDGYTVRTFQQNDEFTWANIELSVGEFASAAKALQHFNQEFGPFKHKLQERCFFIEHESGRVVGTATAWYNNNFQGEKYGRLHWVAIQPHEQGKQLAKPLIGHALQRLAQFHDQAYLTTQSTSYKAIKIYLDFGFIPVMDTPEEEQGWLLVESVINHPVLHRALSSGGNT